MMALLRTIHCFIKIKAQMVTSGFYLEMNFDRIDTKIERGGIMDKIEIVIVTGMSGAGKQLQWLLL